MLTCRMLAVSLEVETVTAQLHIHSEEVTYVLTHSSTVSVFRRLSNMNIFVTCTCKIPEYRCPVIGWVDQIRIIYRYMYV